MKSNKRGLVIVLLAALLLAGLAGGALFVEEPLEAFALGTQADGDDASEVEDDGEEAEDEAEGPDEPITGEALEQASAAALEYVGQGRVTETEVGDEEGYYEVEITLDDGRQVDVHLTENFEVLGQEADE